MEKLKYDRPDLKELYSMLSQAACENGSAQAFCSPGGLASDKCQATGTDAVLHCTSTGSSATGECVGGTGLH